MKINRINDSVLIALTLISLIMISFTLTVQAQTITQVNPADYGGGYKVKAGDTVQYNTTKYLSLTPISSALNTVNNTPVLYNSSIGTIETIKIKNVTQINNVSQIFSEVNVVNSRINLNLTVLTNQTPMLGYAFANSNDVKNYFNAVQQLNTSSNYLNQTYTNLGIDGDYYNQILNVTLPYNYYTFNFTINWRTGWTQSLDLKSYLNNGTLIYESKEVLLQNSQTSQISTNIFFSFNNLGLIIGLSVISIGILITIVSFVIYQKSPEKNAKKISFNKFIREKVKKKQHKEKVRVNQTDKALEMIEEIIDETKK